MAVDASESEVLALEEVFILLMMLNEAICCINLGDVTATVAATTLLAVSVDLQRDALRILDV